MPKVSKTKDKNKVWIKTAFPGIFYREVFDKEGKLKDHYYNGWYQVKGERYQVAFGSKNKFKWTPQKCADKMSEFRQNAKAGIKPRDFGEERELQEAKRAETKKELEEIERKSITLSEFFEDTYYPQAKVEKKESSYLREKNLFDLWIKPKLGGKPLVSITVSDLENLKTYLLTGDEDHKPKKPRTVEYTLAVIRQIFNKAIAQDVYKGMNPVKKVGRQKFNNQKDRYLSREEADKLLTALKKKSYQTWLLALMSLHTGARFGELANLLWTDVDFETNLIRFEATKNTETRYVPMSRQVRQELESKEHEGKHVFLDKKGHPIQSVSKMFFKVVDEIGLNDNLNERKPQRINFHSLRHTFASWQVQAGMPIYTLSKLLGHKSTQMTSRYAHLAQQNLNAATAIFDQEEEENAEDISTDAGKLEQAAGSEE
jgi:integrase